MVLVVIVLVHVLYNFNLRWRILATQTVQSILSTAHAYVCSIDVVCNLALDSNCVWNLTQTTRRHFGLTGRILLPSCVACFIQIREG